MDQRPIPRPPAGGGTTLPSAAETPIEDSRTGDAAVDAILRHFDESPADPQAQLEAAAEAHRLLQERLMQRRGD